MTHHWPTTQMGASATGTGWPWLDQISIPCRRSRDGAVLLADRPTSVRPGIAPGYQPYIVDLVYIRLLLAFPIGPCSLLHPNWPWWHVVCCCGPLVIISGRTLHSFIITCTNAIHDGADIRSFYLHFVAFVVICM